jgi:hypothetical protein
MKQEDESSIFTDNLLQELFPKDRADGFFDAIFGDVREGAYDIDLAFREMRPDTLVFEMRLSRRPGKCLACNLTYGLPEVFVRHPIIDISGLVAAIEERLGGKTRCVSWRLEHTREIDRDLHVIPLIITLENAD